MAKMTYVGEGAFIPHVPARDLTDDEVTRYGGVAILEATGLYKPIEAPKKTAKSDKKDGE